jgi:hypothetical protein
VGLELTLTAEHELVLDDWFAQCQMTASAGLSVIVVDPAYQPPGLARDLKAVPIAARAARVGAECGMLEA